MEDTTPSPREMEFLVAIMDSLPMGIIALDNKGSIRTINRRASEVLGITQDIDRTWGTHICSYIEKDSQLYESLSESLQAGDLGICLESISYNHHYINITGRRIMEGYLLIVHPLSEPGKMEAQSIRSMIKGQETERRRLSKEIHDGLAPLLSTIKINLEAINMEIEKYPQNPALEKKLNSIHELINTLAEDMRQISHSLMPKVLEDFGLAPALESLCNRLNTNEKVEINYYNAGFEERLEKSVELNLYRIAQELVHNALKHSRANQINIQLIRHSETLMLMVEDNGLGFDRKQVNLSTNGIGLKNIETRTKMLGGTFYIDTSQGKGVTATLEVPLKNHAWQQGEKR